MDLLTINVLGSGFGAAIVVSAIKLFDSYKNRKHAVIIEEMNQKHKEVLIQVEHKHKINVKEFDFMQKKKELGMLTIDHYNSLKQRAKLIVGLYESNKDKDKSPQVFLNNLNELFNSIVVELPIVNLPEMAAATFNLPIYRHPHTELMRASFIRNNDLEGYINYVRSLLAEYDELISSVRSQIEYIGFP